MSGEDSILEKAIFCYKFKSKVNRALTTNQKFPGKLFYKLYNNFLSSCLQE